MEKGDWLTTLYQSSLYGIQTKIWMREGFFICIREADATVRATTISMAIKRSMSCISKLHTGEPSSPFSVI